MLLFNFLSWAIEKCLKFGSMELNMKHSTNLFRKVAAPTGQNNFKEIILFKLTLFSVLCIHSDEKHHIYSSYLIFWREFVQLGKYINILSMAKI